MPLPMYKATYASFLKRFGECCLGLRITFEEMQKRKAILDQVCLDAFYAGELDVEPYHKLVDHTDQAMYHLSKRYGVKWSLWPEVKV